MRPEDAERHVLHAQQALDLARKRLAQLHADPDAYGRHYAEDEHELEHRIQNAEKRLQQAWDALARAEPGAGGARLPPASFHDRSRY